MVFLEFFDPLGVGLLVSVVQEILVATFPFTLFETMALSMPFVASDEYGIVECRGVLDDCTCKKLLVNCFAVEVSCEIFVPY